jgi:tRNA(Phe) wybutosine-synthesizing methylase Tyw3
MISSKELEHVVAQVNSKFEELFKKLAVLEKQIAENTGTKNVKSKRLKTS